MVKKIIGLLDFMQVTLFSGLVALSFASVFMRYALNYSLTWAEELARYMFIWLVYLGTALCVRRRKHIVMDIVIASMKPGLKKIFSLIDNLIMLVFVLVLARQGFKMMPILSTQASTALQIPMSFIYAAIPVGAVLMAFYLVLDCVLVWRNESPEEMRERSDTVDPDAI